MSLFRVDNDTVPVNEYIHYKPGIKEPISPEEAKTFIDEHVLVLGSLDHLQQMPRMTNWLKGKDEAGIAELRAIVVDTMIQAFVATDTNHTFTEKRLQKMRNDFTGFSMTMLQPGHPNFTVAGNCACMGPLPQGMVILGEGYWPYGFAEYDLHNIDAPHQEIALYAGAGALAQLCELEIGIR